jgi:aminobenzoyl-glutamate utilization protein B
MELNDSKFLENIKQDIKNWANENKERFYKLADDIWENPELGLEEYYSVSRILGILKQEGFKIETGMGDMNTAFVATYGNEGPIVGLNVEYDALPGLSQKKEGTEPVPITDGAPGHGCGHNILGSAAVMAGIAIKNMIDKHNIKARIKLLGSPYEEASVGKPFIAKDGIYKEVDFILDWHPWNYNRADYDACNSVFVMKFHFKGKTCHGAMPWQGGRSALDAGMLFAHSLEMLREHIIPNGPEAANTINYTFTDTGPEFANIVPDRTSMQLYGRFHSMDVSKDALRRIILCAKGAAMATETTVEEEYMTYTHNKIPNKALSEIVHKNFRQIGVPEFSKEEQQRVKKMQKYMGLKEVGLDTKIKEFGPSETIICDTSEFSWNAPYSTFWMTMGPPEGWHNWMVTALAGSSVGKKTMDKAVLVMASSAIEILTKPDVIKQAKEEWKERLGDKKYEFLLPEEQKPPFGANEKVMDKYYPNRKKNIEF